MKVCEKEKTKLFFQDQIVIIYFYCINFRFSGYGWPYNVPTSVADLDPYVFRPPGAGSGSIGQRYGFGSFHHQAKKKPFFDSYVLRFLYDFFIFEKLCKCRYLQKVISRKNMKFLKFNDENSRIRIRTKMSWIRNTGPVLSII